MSQSTNIQERAFQPSFIRFSFQDKKNRKLFGIATIGGILQFALFKLLYPFPDFFSDSYSYIYAASANLDINIWPIGYSKFLMAFHSVTHSDTALVGFQYFSLELASIYFFFTILYFYNPGKLITNTLLIFLFFNPLSLYLSNYVNSDPLFAALSIFWFTQLLWIINKPRLHQVFMQAILLFFCFAVRNNAYYYPFIAFIAFASSRQQVWVKLAGMVTPLVLIIPFIIHSRNEAYKLTGTHQFSLFTGWQLANNALYMRGQISVDSNQLPSAETKELDQISRKFYSNVAPDFNDYLSAYVANFYIREPAAPLKKYFSKHYQSKNEYDNIKTWGQSSVVFETYGKYLIKQYPLSFVRYFMLRNTKNYFLPPLEKLEIYNLGDDDVWSSAQDWFDYTSPEVVSISKEFQGRLLSPFPYLFLFVNLCFIGSVGWFLTVKGFKKGNVSLNKTLLLAGSFLIANFVFCVFTTIIVLRYQVFPMIICCTFTLLLVEFLDQKQFEKKKVVSPPIEGEKSSFELIEL